MRLAIIFVTAMCLYSYYSHVMRRLACLVTKPQTDLLDFKSNSSQFV